MRDYRQLESTFMSTVGLSRRPVAIAFRAEAPEGVERFGGTEPSGCSFWRLAAEGRAFYTEDVHHYNCPIGSFTHNFVLPEERAAELTGTLSLMAELGYVKMEEIPSIFRLSKTPGAVVYAPLGDTPCDPDVVIFTGRPGRLMLLMEAAQRAGAASNLPLLARPTCMAIPAALANGAVASSGCIGNRVYTEIGEDELYVAAPAGCLERLAAESEVIVSANRKLAEYHQERARTLRA